MTGQGDMMLPVSTLSGAFSGSVDNTLDFKKGFW